MCDCPIVRHYVVTARNVSWPISQSVSCASYGGWDAQLNRLRGKGHTEVKGTTDRTKPVLQFDWRFPASERQPLLKGHQDAGCPLWPVAWVLHFQGREHFLTQPGLQPRGTEPTLYCAQHTSLADITSVYVHTLVGTLRKSFIWENRVTLGDSQLGSVSITSHVHALPVPKVWDQGRKHGGGGCREGF